MSKPRWIDAGTFRTLRTATRKRSLAVIVGPQLGSAEVSSRAGLKDVADRAALAEDGRLKSEPDPGLTALFTLRQPGLITTAVSNALPVSAPAGEEEPTYRLYGPNSKGLKGAWERKDPFIVRLCGAGDDPASLVLTGKDRKALMSADSRYQAFLRATFRRTVLFVGFELGDPDLNELLDDVARCFNGHVPPNMALVPAGTADPAAALRANMHYGMTVVEFPAELGTSQAVAEAATLLEELEVPKPATGNPPPGFTELDESFRGAQGGDDGALAAFDQGDSSSWAPTAQGLDVPRSVADGLAAALVGEVPEGQVAIALLRGARGEGKTTLARRVAWKLAEDGNRVFWREPGADVPDRYVPAEADDARAIFVIDDAEELAQLPVLIRSLVRDGKGKARFLLSADTHQWDRSGLDHRVRTDTTVHEARLEGLAEGEAEALGARLAERGVLDGGRDAGQATAALSDGSGPLLDRITQARFGQTCQQRVQAAADALGTGEGAERQRRAWLATALVHRHGMALGRRHLAALLGMDEGQLDAEVLQPLGENLVSSLSSAVRTPHPLVAEAVVAVLGADEAARDELIVDLLRTLPGGSVDHPIVFHRPSELLRARRQEPIAPLMLGRLFEAGEEAARNDVLFWFDRGRYETDFSRWDAALAAFDQALWRRPDEPREKEHNALVQANRARCLQSLGRKADALAAVEEGLRLSPRDSVLLRLSEKLGGRRRRSQGPGGRGGARRGGGGGRSGSGGRSGGGDRRPSRPGAGRPGPAPRA